MKPVPPEPAVMTMVRLSFSHGLAGGNGEPGAEPVRLSEKSEVRPTSGIVPLEFAVQAPERNKKKKKKKVVRERVCVCVCVRVRVRAC